MTIQRKAIALAVIAIITSLTTVEASAEQKYLNIYNWSDYIGENTIKNFEKETGILVRYDTYDNNETLHAKILAGRTGYDIVVPSSQFAKAQLESGLYMKLDKSQLPNLKNYDPAVQAQIAKIDPGNQYLVNWAWGYTTLGYNVDKVKKALGDMPMPKNTWDLLFDEKYSSKLKSCGISILDSASDVLPAALNYLGKPNFSKNQADYTLALAMLDKIRPNIQNFTSSGYINDLAAGNYCLSLGFNGDINIAKNRAIENKTGQKIVTAAPLPGDQLFFDSMAIPVDAPNPESALLFMNYVMQPKVQAEITNKVKYAIANVPAKEFIKPEIAKDTTVFLTKEQISKMSAPDAVTNAIRKMMTRAYQRFKIGV